MLRVTKMAAVMVALLGLSASPAVAATINVKTTQDEPNNNQCALREAVAAANTGAGYGWCPAGDPRGTKIVLGAGRYVLTSGELTVNSSVTITGRPGATVIDGLGLSRLFTVTPTGNLTLSGVTLTHGRAPDGSFSPITAPGGPGGAGGAMQNLGVLALNHVAVVGNRAGNGGSGAMSASGGQGGAGGGIESAGASLTIADSTIAANRAGDAGWHGGQGGDGGGIDVLGGSFSITGSTISGNVAGNGAAGPYWYNATGGDGGDGGGLALSNSALGSLANDTIAGNAAGHADPNASFFSVVPSSGGGAIYQAGGRVALTQVTVADNTEEDYEHLTGNISTTGGMIIANSALEATCHGPVTDGGHNFTLPGSDPGTYGQPACPGTQLAVTAFDLGALQNNGGPTQTMLPQPGSALINAVPSKGAGSLATDQRGVSRPQGPASDAGSVEVGAPVVAVQPRPVRFGRLHVGHVLRKTVRVRVAGGEVPMQITSAQLTGWSARDFAITKNRCRGRTLNPGQSGTLVISFRPRDHGVLKANLILNAPTFGKPVKIALVGTGTP